MRSREGSRVEASSDLHIIYRSGPGHKVTPAPGQRISSWSGTTRRTRRRTCLRGRYVRNSCPRDQGSRMLQGVLQIRCGYGDKTGPTLAAPCGSRFFAMVLCFPDRCTRRFPGFKQIFLFDSNRFPPLVCPEGGPTFAPNRRSCIHTGEPEEAPSCRQPFAWKKSPTGRG
jgi:hypothetical protein